MSFLRQKEDVFALALYQHTSTRATKKSVFDDLGLRAICTYKTFERKGG